MNLQFFSHKSFIPFWISRIQRQACFFKQVSTEQKWLHSDLLVCGIFWHCIKMHINAYKIQSCTPMEGFYLMHSRSRLCFLLAGNRCRFRSLWRSTGCSINNLNLEILASYQVGWWITGERPALFFPFNSPRLSRVSWKGWAVWPEMTSPFSSILNSWLEAKLFFWLNWCLVALHLNIYVFLTLALTLLLK